MVLVTGAAGRLGRLVVLRLIDKGYCVLGTDREVFEDSPSPFVQAELCDMAQANALLVNVEAAIHMGAISGPGTDEYETFRNNTLSTFNIMWAAMNQNLSRIVFSSSAFGMGWAHDPSAFVPFYLPLDEEHPMMPFEPYGLSKQIGECIGEMVARSATTSIVSLRFTNVVSPEQQAEFPPNTLPGTMRRCSLSLVAAIKPEPNLKQSRMFGDYPPHMSTVVTAETVRLLRARCRNKLVLMWNLLMTRRAPVPSQISSSQQRTVPHQWSRLHGSYRVSTS